MELSKVFVSFFRIQTRCNEVHYTNIWRSSLQKKMNYTPVFGLHAKSMVIDGKQLWEHSNLDHEVIIWATGLLADHHLFKENIFQRSVEWNGRGTEAWKLLGTTFGIILIRGRRQKQLKTIPFQSWSPKIFVIINKRISFLRRLLKKHFLGWTWGTHYRLWTWDFWSPACLPIPLPWAFQALSTQFTKYPPSIGRGFPWAERQGFRTQTRQLYDYINLLVGFRILKSKVIVLIPQNIWG